MLFGTRGEFSKSFEVERKERERKRRGGRDKTKRKEEKTPNHLCPQPFNHRLHSYATATDSAKS